jgi:hypothetical protein
MDPGAGMAKISTKDIRKACTDLGGFYSDFNQIYTDAFNNLCDDDDDKRPGLCHGLSIIWMYYAVHQGRPNIITSSWVDGVGWQEVSSVCNPMFTEFNDPNGGHNWTKCANTQMKLKGFKNPEIFTDQWRDYINWLLDNKGSYMTVEIYGLRYGHTVSVYKTSGGTVHFFDANEGYFRLPSVQKFKEWFVIWAEAAEQSFGTWYQFVCYT